MNIPSEHFSQFALPGYQAFSYTRPTRKGAVVAVFISSFTVILSLFTSWSVSTAIEHALFFGDPLIGVPASQFQCAAFPVRTWVHTITLIARRACVHRRWRQHWPFAFHWWLRCWLSRQSSKWGIESRNRSSHSWGIFGWRARQVMHSPRFGACAEPAHKNRICADEACWPLFCF